MALGAERAQNSLMILALSVSYSASEMSFWSSICLARASFYTESSPAVPAAPAPAAAAGAVLCGGAM